MTTIVTSLDLYRAFAAAGRVRHGGPQRRIRMEIDQRLRGLRGKAAAGRSRYWRQQQLTGISFISRLESDEAAAVHD